MIEDTSVKTVGGSVQQGVFGADNNFYILAINDKQNLDAKVSLHGFLFLQNVKTLTFGLVFLVPCGFK